MKYCRRSFSTVRSSLAALGVLRTDFHLQTAFHALTAVAFFQMGSCSSLFPSSSLCPGSIVRGLLNVITSPPPAVRSIRIMNRSLDPDVASEPPPATWRSSLAASMRWRGDVEVSFKILPSTSGAWTNSDCAFSLAAAPLAMRCCFSRCTARQTSLNIDRMILAPLQDAPLQSDTGARVTASGPTWPRIGGPVGGVTQFD